MQLKQAQATVVDSQEEAVRTLLTSFQEGSERVSSATIEDLFPCPDIPRDDYYKGSALWKQWQTGLRHIRDQVRERARINDGMCIVSRRGGLILLTGPEVDDHVEQQFLRLIKTAVSTLKRAEDYKDLSPSKRAENVGRINALEDYIAPRKKTA